jgi:nicotinate-nucleotide adenylyltransferase
MLNNNDHIRQLAILGGTFDPPHTAHLNIATEACNQLGIDDIALLPCHIPPLKSSPSVAVKHRLNMLKLVSESRPGVYIDDRELLTESTSYTINTLEALKTEQPDTKLFFIIGTDNLLTFDKWHRWQDILQFCHLIVCHRNSTTDNKEYSLDELSGTIKKHIITDVKQCQLKASGCIFLAQTTRLDISSTEIRSALEQGHDVSKWLTPEVYNYIKQNRLYQRLHNTC